MMDTEEKYKVVIIDDERSASDALRRELEPYREFEIKGIASSGAKGKKMIMELHPDLLFLDVELPDILGLNLLSEIKDDVLWDMKVVFYTSYDKYLLQALRESAFDFLLKPFSAEDLKVVIDRYRKAVRSAVVAPPSFASSIIALMPQQGMFMISTVTGFKLLRLEEIGFFEAPCSGGNHLACQFGLVHHSRNVMMAAENIGYALLGKVKYAEIRDSVIIAAALHDLGKCGDFGKQMYVPTADPPRQSRNRNINSLKASLSSVTRHFFHLTMQPAASS